MLKILDIDNLICSLINKISSKGLNKYYKIRNEIPDKSQFDFLRMKIAIRILTSKNYDYDRLDLDREGVLEKINSL